MLMPSNILYSAAVLFISEFITSLKTHGLISSDKRISAYFVKSRSVVPCRVLVRVDFVYDRGVHGRPSCLFRSNILPLANRNGANKHAMNEKAHQNTNASLHFDVAEPGPCRENAEQSQRN